MGDGVLSPGSMLGEPSGPSMDLDYIMDELFLDGCWLETTDGLEFLCQSPSNSTALLDPSCVWPTLEIDGDLCMSPSQKGNQEERQSPLLNESQETPFDKQLVSQNMINMPGSSSSHSEIGLRRWWIGPTAYPGPASSVMERLLRALLHIKNFVSDKDVLVQIWVPLNKGGRNVLTTNDLPFSLDSNCKRLAKYRDISVKYQFSAEEDSKEVVVGLPSRVFSGKVPEWTPDVRFFRSDEYPRVDHAQQYDVRGTLALPVFEQGNRTCLGVIEVVMTTRRIKYLPELENVCKALEAFDLRSSEVLSTQNVKVHNKSYQAALPEIQEVLRSACETHKLPLAQTWVSCAQQGKDGCRHSDMNYFQCVSTVDHACYVGEPLIQGFHEACSEHHLLKGQGVVGGAFLINQPCFSPDITSLGKTEYPLSHHARMFGLQAAAAIRLRSIHTNTDDFVLEFFLPIDCTDPEEQKKTLTSLSLIIQRVCHNLRVITAKELEEETCLSVVEDISSRTACSTEFQESGTVGSLIAKEKSNDMMGGKFSDPRQNDEDSNLKGSAKYVGEFSTVGEGSFSSAGASKTGEKRRTKAEKTITLEVLRQHFAGSLKDAARNLGVCTTTLKRICRQHGVKRWPSRKIKKVGHSLQKLQLVIDSVQGASGAFQIDSFYSNFPELASPNLSGSCPFSTSKQSDHLKPSSMQPEAGMLTPEAAASKSHSSSCSQNSISSHSCSSRSEQHYPTCNIAGEDSADCVLKSIRSEAELKTSNRDGEKLLEISQSHETHSLRDEHPKTQFLQSLPKSRMKASQRGDGHRVKVTYGDDKTRFRLQKNWSYEDLLQEIAMRFNINDMSNFDIKYLDDDSEWVLLTCNVDLEECIDVCQSSQSSTIKLSINVSNHCLRTSLGGRAPS